MHLENLLCKYPNLRSQILQIVGEHLNYSKEQITAHFNEITVSPARLNIINKTISDLKKGVPLPYCILKKCFYNIDLKVNKYVLIPRCETEILAEKAIKIAKKIRRGNVLDVGTGSGNIIIVINKAVGNHLNYYAVDKSPEALAVARLNAKSQKLNNIRFYKSDLFSNTKLPNKFDLIVANLPYLRSNYLKSLPQNLANNLKAEPQIALDGGSDGLEIIRKFLFSLGKKMHNEAVAIIEIGDNQKRKVVQICRNLNFKTKLIKDLNGFDRFVVIRKRTRQA